jgi:WD40 repeat protein
MACGWSPDGRRIVSGSDDNSLKVWDAQSGQCVLTLQGHSNAVSACGFSPDGQRIISGSGDKSLKVWDATTGQCLWTGHLFPEMQVAAIDHAANRVLYASPEAWRFIGWRVFDPEIGHLRLLPAETFGPLPG